MKKIAIKLSNNIHDAHLIFHATPVSDAYSLYKYQWYLTEDKKLLGKPIEEEKYESYTITTEIIKKKGYDNLYLYCKCTNIRNNKETNTEFIRLFSDVNKIIDSDTIFDKVSTYDENGMIL